MFNYVKYLNLRSIYLFLICMQHVQELCLTFLRYNVVQVFFILRIFLM